jgi:hypothetical protein
MKKFFSLFSPLRGRANAMLLAVAIAVSLCGCGNNDRIELLRKVQGETIRGENYATIEVDSCEYLLKPMIVGEGYLFTHKGNCKFCAERNKK